MVARGCGEREDKAEVGKMVQTYSNKMSDELMYSRINMVDNTGLFNLNLLNG